VQDFQIINFSIFDHDILTPILATGTEALGSTAAWQPDNE